jgi:hypothetical protein
LLRDQNWTKVQKNTKKAAFMELMTDTILVLGMHRSGTSSVARVVGPAWSNAAQDFAASQ